MLEYNQKNMHLFHKQNKRPKTFLISSWYLIL